MLRVFSHYIPGSLIALVIVEVFVLYASVYLGVELRFIDSQDKEASILLLQPLQYKALVFAIIMLGCMTAMGLHTRSIVDNFSSMMIRIFLSFALGIFLITLIYYIYPGLFLGRGVVAITFIVAFMGILLTRTVHQNLDKHSIFKRKLLVIGAGSKGKLLEDKKAFSRSQGYEIVGFVAIDEDNVQINKENILAIETSLYDLCMDSEVDEIVLAMDDRRKGFPLSSLLECKMKGIVVRDALDSLERITGHIELDALHPSAVIFSDGFTNAVSASYVKRVFDVLSSSLILLITSPIIIITAASIWLSTFGRDPVFYRQVRLGLCDSPFNVLKFRSMKTDAEKEGAQFAKKNDTRVTLIGRFIRKTRIDELPQLLNVLKGDMSFIGPRPERPQFVLGFEQSIPHYSLRHTVKPGITGWAQICYPYGDTEEDTRNKLQYDLYYIKNYSLFLDLTILLQTVQVVLFGRGAR